MLVFDAIDDGNDQNSDFDEKIVIMVVIMMIVIMMIVIMMIIIGTWQATMRI